MSMIRITGLQLAAERALAGLSRQDLADRAHLSYYSIRDWERSSAATPLASYGHLCRAIAVLESEGIRFTDGGVERTRPTASTVIESARSFA